ncbi:MAG: PEP-CTERM sorting domain-containing protein [Pyrinomonadaceae bacterium]|nr:PEP-CTERM sorting domain-containing protein [Pyrinomonadaceae bacterium]
MLNRKTTTRLFLSLVFLTLSSVAVGADPVVLTGPVVNPANGHTYYLLSSDTWTASQSAAVALGGNLVTINDSAENAWVFTTFAGFGGVTNRFLWIGLNDVAVEGTFEWANGELLTFTNWSFGEPNNTGGNENYVGMYPIAFSGGEWNDFNNGTFQGFESGGVVEIVPTPEPVTILLFATGLTGFAAGTLRRRGQVAR